MPPGNIDREFGPQRKKANITATPASANVSGTAARSTNIRELKIRIVVISILMPVSPF
jgi:hypothetical protein